MNEKEEICFLSSTFWAEGVITMNDANRTAERKEKHFL